MVLTQGNIWLQLWGDTWQGDRWLPAICICGIWGPQGMWRCILQDGQCAYWWPAHTRWLQPECGTHSVERQRCAVAQLIVDILWAVNLICVRKGSCLYVCACVCDSDNLSVICMWLGVRSWFLNIDMRYIRACEKLLVQHSMLCLFLRCLHISALFLLPIFQWLLQFAAVRFMRGHNFHVVSETVCACCISSANLPVVSWTIPVHYFC